MKRRFSVLSLCLLLCVGLLPIARATALPPDPFPAVGTYPGFSDVADQSWYAANVKICYEIGLMQGDGIGFRPNHTLTVAETAVIAARIHSAVTGEAPAPAAAGAPWYQSAVDTLTALGAPGLGTPSADATREGFLLLLAAVTPGELLDPINEISALPDTARPEILAFYNAGILTGTDYFGTFAGGKTLTRAEAAAMVSRLARPGLRLSFTPASVDDVIIALTGLPGSTVLFTSNTGISIPAEDYYCWVAYYLLEVEQASENQGIPFHWSNKYGEETFSEYVTAQALQAASRYAIIEVKAAEYQVTLSEDDLAMMDEVLASMAEALGGPEAFSAFLRRNALTEASYQRVIRRELLSMALGRALHEPTPQTLATWMEKEGRTDIDAEVAATLYRESMMRIRLNQWVAELTFTPTAQGAAIDLPAFYESLQTVRAQHDYRL